MADENELLERGMAITKQLWGERTGGGVELAQGLEQIAHAVDRDQRGRVVGAQHAAQPRVGFPAVGSVEERLLGDEDPRGHLSQRKGRLLLARDVNSICGSRQWRVSKAQ